MILPSSFFVWVFVGGTLNCTDGAGQLGHYGVTANGLRAAVTSIEYNGKELRIKYRLEWSGKGNYAYDSALDRSVISFWDNRGRKLDADVEEECFLPIDFITRNVTSLQMASSVKIPPGAASVSVKLAGPGVATPMVPIPTRERP